MPDRSTLQHQAVARRTPARTTETSSLRAAAFAGQLMSPADMLTAQRTLGNRAALRAQRSIERKPIMEGELDASVGNAITRSRGGGSPLPIGLRGSLEQSFQSDFGGVRVHTDAQSDQLNRSVQAKAFTVGSDIYFRKGNYQPGSTGGKELLAHELTHVVQQGGSNNRVQGKLTLGPVGDRYEQEADRVARQVVRSGGSIGRVQAKPSINVDRSGQIGRVIQRHTTVPGHPGHHKAGKATPAPKAVDYKSMVETAEAAAKQALDEAKAAATVEEATKAAVTARTQATAATKAYDAARAANDPGKGLMMGPEARAKSYAEQAETAVEVLRGKLAVTEAEKLAAVPTKALAAINTSAQTAADEQDHAISAVDATAAKAAADKAKTAAQSAEKVQTLYEKQVVAVVAKHDTEAHAAADEVTSDAANDYARRTASCVETVAAYKAAIAATVTAANTAADGAHKIAAAKADVEARAKIANEAQSTFTLAEKAKSEADARVTAATEASAEATKQAELAREAYARAKAKADELVQAAQRAASTVITLRKHAALAPANVGTAVDDAEAKAAQANQVATEAEATVPIEETRKLEAETTAKEKAEAVTPLTEKATTAEQELATAKTKHTEATTAETQAKQFETTTLETVKQSAAEAKTTKALDDDLRTLVGDIPKVQVLLKDVPNKTELKSLLQGLGYTLLRACLTDTKTLGKAKIETLITAFTAPTLKTFSTAVGDRAFMSLARLIDAADLKQMHDKTAIGTDRLKAIGTQFEHDVEGFKRLQARATLDVFMKTLSLIPPADMKTILRLAKPATLNHLLETRGQSPAAVKVLLASLKSSRQKAKGADLKEQIKDRPPEEFEGVLAAADKGTAKALVGTEDIAALSGAQIKAKLVSLDPEKEADAGKLAKFTKLLKAAAPGEAGKLTTAKAAANKQTIKLTELLDVNLHGSTVGAPIKLDTTVEADRNLLRDLLIKLDPVTVKAFLPVVKNKNNLGKLLNTVTDDEKRREAALAATKFQKVAPPAAKSDPYATTKNYRFVNVDHILERHTYKHNTFADIKVQNTLWPPATTEATLRGYIKEAIDLLGGNFTLALRSATPHKVTLASGIQAEVVIDEDSHAAGRGAIITMYPLEDKTKDVIDFNATQMEGIRDAIV